MPFQFWPKLVAASLALIFCVAVIEAWRADRRDRAQLAAELSATKQLLTAADVRQRDRDAQLSQTLAALAAEKRSVATPAQILHALPSTLPLPEPIILQADHTTSQSTPAAPANPTNALATKIVGASSARIAQSAAASSFSLRSDQNASAGSATIPSADLKPLYDFTLDCQTCQAKLSVAQNDLADEKAKTAALTKERDDALRVAKGGSVLRRITRAAKWFLLGAAAGAIAAKAH